MAGTSSHNRRRLHGRASRAARSRATRPGAGRRLGLEPLEPRQLLAGEPIITEFMASNSGVLRDGDGESSDWIEIYNPGDQELPLAGYRLTDTRQNLNRWSFPSVSLQPGQFLVVFASGQDAGDYVDSAGNLHTNFALARGGEYVALVSPDGMIVSQYGADGQDYPRQLGNVSYGNAACGDPMKVGYLSVATPAASNVCSDEVYSGYVTGVQFSADHGFYDQPLQLQISTQDNLATVRYTTDGSTPTLSNGFIYQGPITISGTTTVRAAAFRPDFLPSAVQTQTYIFLEDVLGQSPAGEAPSGFPSQDVWGQRLDYGMDPQIVNDAVWGPQLIEALTSIPTFSIVTDATNLFDADRGIYVTAAAQGRDWERPASVELIHPEGDDGFQINAGLRIRGGFSRSGENPKHAFRLFFRNDYDGDLRYPLFGDEGAGRFEKVDLRTTQNYSWAFQGDTRNAFLRDVFSRDLQREMSQPYTRSRYYHLYLNGQYWGLYQTQERSEASYGESYFGGDEDDYDVIKVEATGGRRSVATDGNLEAFSRLHQAAVRGLENNEAYFQIQGLNDDGTRDPRFERLLDADNLIDYMIVNYYTGDRDGPGSLFTRPAPNNFFGVFNRANPDGFKWFEHDSEHSIGTGDRNMVSPLYTEDANFDETELANFNPHWLHEKLMDNEEYAIRFADRLQQHFFRGGVLTETAAIEMVDERAREIEKAIVAESARWGDAHASRQDNPLTKDDWLLAVKGIRDFLSGDSQPRSTQVISQLREVGFFPELDAPRFNLHGGVVSESFEIQLQSEVGAIYYTTDGADPRRVGGQLSATAVQLADAISLVEEATIKARVLQDGQWSALVQAEFLIQSEMPLRITEINYHPHSPNPVPAMGELETESDRFEFIELANVGDRTVELGGVQLLEAKHGRDVHGVGFTFAEQTLAPGEHVVVVRDRAAFQSRYGDAVAIALGSDGRGGAQGLYAGELANDGERITLADATGHVIQQFQYAPTEPWPARANGRGSSLEMVDALGDAADPGNWRESIQFGGSPGQVDQVVSREVLVNEVLARTDEPDADLVELRNVSAHDVGIGGWYLSNTENDYFKFPVASSAVIPAFGYHVLSQEDLGFGFDGARGDQVWLVSADEHGRPVRFVDYVQFGSSPNGVSLGPWPTEEDSLVQLAQPTFGGMNSQPRVGDVVITEIHYRPPDPDGALGRLEADDFEFIELHNHTDHPVDLTGWSLSGGTQFAFEEATVVGPSETLTLVGFDPNDRSKPNVFRFTLGADPSARLVGPYSVPLDDQGGTVQLLRLDDPLGDGSGFRPMLLVDEAIYNSVAPWPSKPAGEGSSLTRTRPEDFGSFPTSWRSETPSPGSFARRTRLSGDANEDGQFDQIDLALVLAAGRYMTELPATWAQGDWTGDGRFDQRDIVLALQSGAGPRGNGAFSRAEAVDRILQENGIFVRLELN